MSRVIWRKLIEAEQSSRSIEQWYERMISLDNYQRESIRKEVRLSRKKEEKEKV